MTANTPATPADTIKATMKRAGCPLSIDQQMVLAGSLAVYTDKDDHVQNQLCQRIDELQADKDELIRQLDDSEREIAELRRQLATMRCA